MKQTLIIYWARRDLRTRDNPALTAATEASSKQNVPFLPLFILEDYMTKAEPSHQFGLPSRWFLAHSLPVFAQNFPTFAVVQGKAVKYFNTLAANYDCEIYVNHDVYTDFYTQVEKIRAAGIRIYMLEDAFSVHKETKSGEGNPYSVFTPFKKNVWAQFVAPKMLPDFDPTLSVSYLPPAAVAQLPQLLESTVGSLENVFSVNRLLAVAGEVIDLATLTPEPQLAGWYTSETEALARFSDYLVSGDLDAYKTNRDSLELDAANLEESRQAYTGKTSKMSLALAWGLVSSRTLVAMMQKHFGESFDNPFSDRVSGGALIYISELIWREFYRYQLFRRPDLMDTEFQKKFQGTIKWVEHNEALVRFTAWIKGETGYPVVDAAMKQLAETGWMHNRSRMIVASILTKNLGVDWLWGMEYFRATLIDLDEASNCGGWQWGASVGADPKPIRIFNPELQAKNYDASGAYQDRWLGGASILRATSIPIVEHKQARADALRRYGLEKVEPRDY